MRAATVPFLALLLPLAACASPVPENVAATDPTPVLVDRCATIVGQRVWFALFTLTLSEWRPEFEEMRDESWRCVQFRGPS